MLGCAQAATLNEQWHLTEPFKMVFRTTGPDETVRVSPTNVGVFRAWIDWGDGSAKSEITAWNSAALAHVYATAGDHTISITGSFPGMAFNNAGDKLKLREVVAWGKTGFKSLSVGFYGCANMTSSATDGGGSTIANVPSLQNTFYGCSAFNAPIGNWNTRNVQNLAFCFRESGFNSDISAWDTSSVTNMNAVFYLNTAFNQNIGAWNTAKVQNFAYMFYGDTAFNQNIGGWDVGSATSMTGMFQLATAFNQNLSGWCVGNIPTEPASFGNAGTDPVWGTCPYYTAGTITYVGAGTGTTTAAIPAHQAGDVLIGIAFRDGSTTNPTIPTGWTPVTNTTDGTTCSASIGYRVATDSATVSGTWTNATGLVVLVYRNADPNSPVSFAAGSGTGTTITYPANAGWITPQGWTICFAGHGSVDTALETPPTGLTLRASFVDATNEIAAFDSNGATAGWSATDVAAGGTSGNWLAVTLRLKPFLTHT